MKRYVLALVMLMYLFIDGKTLLAQTRADALLEYRRGNYERAAVICREEIAANSGNLEAHVVLCWSLISLARYDEALTFARAGRNLSRYDPRITEILGELSYFQGRNAEALQYFQEYINLAPEGGRIDMVYYFTGEIYIRLGRFRHADIALSTAVHYMPGNALWWTRLAYAKENSTAPADRQDERLRDLSDAVAAYERALSINSQLPDARRGLDRARQALSSR